MNLTIYPTRDASKVNAFINHPAIFQTIGFDPNFASVDIRDRIDQLNYLYLTNGDDALMIFSQFMPGIWEKNNLFLPTCRGREAIDVGKAMLEQVQDYGIHAVCAFTPVTNRKTRWFNRQLGMTSFGLAFDPSRGVVEHFHKELDTCH